MFLVKNILIFFVAIFLVTLFVFSCGEGEAVSQSENNISDFSTSESILGETKIGDEYLVIQKYFYEKNLFPINVGKEEAIPIPITYWDNLFRKENKIVKNNMNIKRIENEVEYNYHTLILKC